MKKGLVGFVSGDRWERTPTLFEDDRPVFQTTQLAAVSWDAPQVQIDPEKLTANCRCIALFDDGTQWANGEWRE